MERRFWVMIMSVLCGVFSRVLVSRVSVKVLVFLL